MVSIHPAPFPQEMTQEQRLGYPSLKKDLRPENGVPPPLIPPLVNKENENIIFSRTLYAVSMSFEENNVICDILIDNK